MYPGTILGGGVLPNIHARLLPRLVRNRITGEIDRDADLFAVDIDRSAHEAAKHILFDIGDDTDIDGEVDKMTTDEINQRLLEINREFLCTAEWDNDKADDAGPDVERGAYEHPLHCPALRDHEGVRGNPPGPHPLPPPMRFMTF